jgi:hypothetical protein
MHPRLTRAQNINRPRRNESLADQAEPRFVKLQRLRRAPITVFDELRNGQLVVAGFDENVDAAVVRSGIYIRVATPPTIAYGISLSTESPIQRRPGDNPIAREERGDHRGARACAERRKHDESCDPRPAAVVCLTCLNRPILPAPCRCILDSASGSVIPAFSRPYGTAVRKVLSGRIVFQRCVRLRATAPRRM